MADLTTIVEQLHSALLENDRQRQALLSDSERIQAAIRALGHEAVTPVAPLIDEPAPAETRPGPSESRPKQPATRPKPAPAAGRNRSTVPCPKCGFMCSPQNMWRHDRSAHGAKAVTPVAPLEPKAPAPAAQAQRKVKALGCTECDFTTDIANAKALSHHTITTPRRGPLRSELTPIEVAA